MKIFLQLLFAGCLILALPLGTSVAEEKAELTKAEIEDIVRNYILENPEIIAQAVMILQDREEVRAREETKVALAKNHDLLYDDPLSIVLGNPEGDVTLVEFYDYRCPYCRESHTALVELLAEDKNLRIVLKQFPVKDQPGEVPVSQISARLALAAEEQGLFPAFHDAMFSAKPPLTKSRVFAIAAEVGMDMEQVENALKNPNFTRHIRQTMTVASEIGATGTPTFVIGTYVIPSRLDADDLRKAIAYVRQEKADREAEAASE